MSDTFAPGSRFHRTWMRTQEAWLLSASPEVIQRASPRLLQRLGFSAHTIGTIEGHGLSVLCTVFWLVF